ncbi:hypothetical protein [Pokkaliibacter sp. CJK22405]|uniref:hypothetical protein n=1 Tax=Pokkaliibacter sp. CJK22405 TaxID=3384615 RepID=UPI003985155C
MTTSIRNTIKLYDQFGHSEASPLAVASSKPEHFIVCQSHVPERTMEWLKIGNSVAKTIDKLCDKGNQVDSIYATERDSMLRTWLLNNANTPLDGDMVRNHFWTGNCQDLRDLAEHILAAISDDRRATGTHFATLPVTRVSWPSMDHTSSLIGDPRMQPLNEVVLVDGWVMRPAAQTFEESGLQHTPRDVSSSTVSESRYYLDKSKETLDTKTLFQMHKSKHFVETRLKNLDKDNLKELNIVKNPKETAGKPLLWDAQWIDQQNHRRTYYSSDSQGPINFDYMPRQQLEEKEATSKAAEGLYPNAVRIHL